VPHRFAFLLPLVLSAACAEHDAASAPGVAEPVALASAGAGDASAGPFATPVEDEADCALEIQDAMRESALPGAPGLEARRAGILGRAKAEPVLFRRAPAEATEVNPEVASLRLRLGSSPSPAYTLASLYKNVRNRPEIARQLFLREGYLYTESPGLAAAYVDLVELHHLFDEPELVIQRGSDLLHAKKGASFWYEYTDGPERGQRARVLLLDRIWPKGRDPGPPLHLDLRSVVVDSGVERIRVKRITDFHLVADVRHGVDWVPALFDIDDTHVKLRCEAVPLERMEAVAHARDLAARRQKVLSRLRSTIVTMVGEALPFDEPRTEEGQQDGNLRPAWRWAYTHGWDSYTFNDDTYLVFDSRGRPKIPQVCIDFITDTIERASGTWWTPRDHERQRLRGGVDFDEVGIENRRSVDVFISFAEQHPEWFDVYELADEERVRFFERDRFFEHLVENADRYAPGDIVAIHGPRSDGENHWHSFYVYDADPVTGMPILLASNAGKPRVRSWEGEMRAAPRRSIHTRVRPRLDWLESVLRRTDGRVTPPPLISAPM